MPRPARSSLPDGLFHVVAHASTRDRLFYDDLDRKLYIGLLQSSAERFGWRVLTFVLMGNHVHLLVESPVAGLSRGMWSLHGRYAARFNERHERRGHVFEGRFKAKAVRHERYLAAAVRYIAMNPVEAGLCRSPEEYRWSAHGVIVGAAPALPLVDLETLLSRWSDDLDVARRAYLRLFEDEDRGMELMWLLREGGPDAPLRAAERGYSLAEIADALGMHRTTIHRRIASARRAGRSAG